MRIQLTAVYEKVAEGYIGYIEELPGANAQGETLDDARASLAEAVETVLEANRELAEAQLGTREVIKEPMSFTE